MIKRFRHMEMRTAIYESSSIEGELQSIINIAMDHDDINAMVWKNNNLLGLDNDPDMIAAVLEKPDRLACLRMIGLRDTTEYLTPESMDVVRNVAERMMQVIDIAIEVNGVRYVTLEQLADYSTPVSVNLFIMPRAGDFFFNRQYGSEQKGFVNYELNRIVLWTHKPFNTRNGPIARGNGTRDYLNRLSFGNERTYVVGEQPSNGDSINGLYYDKHVTKITHSEVDLTYKYKYIIDIEDD